MQIYGSIVTYDKIRSIITELGIEKENVYAIVANWAEGIRKYSDIRSCK